MGGWEGEIEKRRGRKEGVRKRERSKENHEKRKAKIEV